VALRRLRIADFRFRIDETLGESLRFSSTPNPQSAIRNPQSAETSLGGFRPGDRVLHAKFGQGQVINVKNLSDDQDVTIKFQDGVVRTLSANFARLQKR